MVDVVLGSSRVGSRLCHQSLRLVVVITVMPVPSPLDSPSASYRRSAPSSLWSKPKVRDDKWVPYVSDCIVQIEFFYFQKWMNSVCFCYFCVDLFRAPKIMKIFV